MFAFCILHFTGISAHNSQNRVWTIKAENIIIESILLIAKDVEGQCETSAKATHKHKHIYINTFIYTKTMVQCYIGNQMLGGKTYYPQSLFCDRAAPIHKCRHIIFSVSFLNRHQCCHLEISVIAIKKAFVLQNNYYCSTIAFCHLLAHIENDIQNDYTVQNGTIHIQTHFGLHFSVFHVITLLLVYLLLLLLLFLLALVTVYIYLCYFFFEPKQMANHFLLCSRYHLSFHTQNGKQAETVLQSPAHLQ